MFSLARYGPLWPCSLWGRSRARVLDVLPRHFLADFKDSAHSEAPQMGPREPLRVRGAKGTVVSQTQPRRIAASRPAPRCGRQGQALSGHRGGVEAWAIHPTRATARRSGALTLVPLPGQLPDRARQSRLEVDQLRPRRGHDDPDHAVVERTQLRLPVDPGVSGRSSQCT